MILAGGKSSRMGEDKALLPFGEYATLGEYQYEKMSLFFENVYISCKSAKKFGAAKLSYIEEDFIEFAPILGMINSFEKLGADKVFFIGVDIPLVSKEVIDRLHKVSLELDKSVRAYSDNMPHNLVSIIDKRAYLGLKNLVKNGEYKLGLLKKEGLIEDVVFEEIEAFTNLNTKDEYERFNI